MFPLEHSAIRSTFIKLPSVFTPFVLSIFEWPLKPCLKLPLKKDQNLVFKTDYHLMQVKSIAECSNRDHSAILSTFIKLPSVFKSFVLSVFEWPLKTGFTVDENILLGMIWVPTVCKVNSRQP